MKVKIRRTLIVWACVLTSLNTHIAATIAQQSQPVISEQEQSRFNEFVTRLQALNALAANIENSSASYPERANALLKAWDSVRYSQEARNVSGGMYLGAAVDDHSDALRTLGKDNSGMPAKVVQMEANAFRRYLDSAKSNTETFLKLRTMKGNTLSINKVCADHTFRFCS